MTAIPWWEALPLDYGQRAHPAPGGGRSLQVAAAAAADHVLKTGLATAVMTAMLSRLSPGRLQRDLAQVALHQTLASLADPAQVFLPPPDDVPIRRVPEFVPELAALAAVVDRLSFETPYQAVHPELRQPFARRRRNQRAWAQHWTHADGPRPTLIFVHGYTLDAYWINSQMFALRWFFRQGWDILLYTQPFHGRRRETLEPFSGFGYFSHGFAQTNETMLQAICELQVLVGYLLARGAPSVGLSGLSLGGYLTALMAAVDNRLAFAIPNAAVVSPADMIMEWTPLRQVFSVMMPRLGLNLQDFRHIMAIHSPLTYRPLLPPERLLIIAGAGDRFTAPHYQTLLHRHWAGSRLHWFPGNHIMHLQQRDYLRLMRDFMSAAAGDRTEARGRSNA